MNLFKSVLLILFALPALAGEGQEGNGGFAVVCPGKPIQLLDYYELFQNGQKPDLGGAGLKVEERVVYAIERLSAFDFNRKQALLSYLSTFWSDANVVNIPGLTFTSQQVDDPIIQKKLRIGKTHIEPNCTLKQLAQQPYEAHYILYQSTWSQADEITQAGLILHEILYREFLSKGVVDSEMVRSFNKVLASGAISQWNLMTYSKFLGTIGLTPMFPRFPVASFSAVEYSDQHSYYRVLSSGPVPDGNVELCSKTVSVTPVPKDGYYYFDVNWGFPSQYKMPLNDGILDLSCALGPQQMLKVTGKGSVTITDPKEFFTFSSPDELLLNELKHPNVFAQGLISVVDRPVAYYNGQDMYWNPVLFPKISAWPTNHSWTDLWRDSTKRFKPRFEETVMLHAQDYSIITGTLNGASYGFKAIFLERGTGAVLGGTFESPVPRKIWGADVNVYGEISDSKKPVDNVLVETAAMVKILASKNNGLDKNSFSSSSSSNYTELLLDRKSGTSCIKVNGNNWNSKNWLIRRFGNKNQGDNSAAFGKFNKNGTLLSVDYDCDPTK